MVNVDGFRITTIKMKPQLTASVDERVCHADVPGSNPKSAELFVVVGSQQIGWIALWSVTLNAKLVFETRQGQMCVLESCMVSFMCIKILLRVLDSEI